jgi:hypothetical protein
MVCTVTNYLGTGSNPKLHLELGANGPGWKSFTIDYGQPGNIPFSDDPNRQKVEWNVKDENGHCYGTIKLKGSDGIKALWDDYNGGEGRWLVGIEFPNVGAGYYNLTCKEIHQPGSPGPFPNALPATPAIYRHGPVNRPVVLSANGANIVNDLGQTVVLKGVSRPSLEWNNQGQHLSPSDVAYIRGWAAQILGPMYPGVNVIRIPLSQQFWHESQARDVIGSYKQIVDAMIYYSIAQGMAVILDLHRLTSTEQGNMANKASLDFWKDVASTYKSFGTVLLELFNEPYGITQDQWLKGDGGNIVGYQQLYDAVRGTGANNLCIVGGLDWAYDLSFVNSNFCVKGTNVLYCSHPYNPKGESGNSPRFDKNFAGVVGKFPVIFTEFGGNAQNTYKDLDYYKSVISYVNTNGFHYTGWAWWVQPDQPWFPCLIGDWGAPGLNGPAPTAINGGVIVQVDLQKSPGSEFDYGTQA